MDNNYNYQQPQQPQQGYTYQQPSNYGFQQPGAITVPDAGSLLTKGILALVFSEIPLLAFLGIIFGAQGLGMKRKYVNAGVPLTVKAKVGSILSLVGMILSIVMVVFWTIYIVYCFAIGFLFGMSEALGSGAYYY